MTGGLGCIGGLTRMLLEKESMGKPGSKQALPLMSIGDIHNLNNNIIVAIMDILTRGKNTGRNLRHRPRVGFNSLKHKDLGGGYISVPSIGSHIAE